MSEGPVEDELIRIEVDPGQAPLRIDKFLVDRLPNTSRNRIQDGLKSGMVQVNGKAVKANHKIAPGDQIECRIPRKEAPLELEPEDIPLEVLFEDEELMVIQKPAGMVVHPGHGNRSGTLVNALLHHLGTLPESSAMERPGIVHRIDKDTSGVMVVAKTAKALTQLGEQFHEKRTDRHYIALVWGDLEEDEGRIEGYIGRSPRDRKLMEIFRDPERGKYAATRYKVLERFHYVTLVECELETGRTHQIRAHFRSIRKPLFNDATYGGDRILKGMRSKKYEQFVKNCFQLLPRQALHAASLGFKHPGTGEWLHFEPSWPEDLRAVIEKWRNYVGKGVG